MMMTEVATAKIMALTLAVFMSISQFFSAGTQALKDKDYKAAVDAFTKVIEAEVDANPLLEASLLWRAEAFLALGDKKAAATDLDRLLRDHGASPLAAIGRERYKVATGKDWDGVDLSTPERAWASFMRGIMARDLDVTAATCSGELKEELVEDIGDDPDQWDEAVEEIGSYRLVSVTYSEDKKMAMILIKNRDREDDDGEKLIMLQQDGLWRLDREFENQDRGQFEEADLVANEADMTSVKQILLAMQVYHADHDNVWPTNLDDLAGYLGQGARKSQTTGKPFVIATARRTGVPWVFTVKAVNGARIHGVAGTGQAKTTSDEEFRKLAQAAGVKLADEVPPVPLSVEETKTIKALIAQLGAPGFKDRRDAREALAALGEKATPLLMEAREDPDPEIAAQVRKLLEL